MPGPASGPLFLLPYQVLQAVTMRKMALVTLGWNPNPAPFKRRTAKYSVDGGPVTEIEASGVDTVQTKIQASSSVVFWTEVEDDDGTIFESERHSFTISDGVKSEPDTGLFHNIDGFVDEEDEIPVDPIVPANEF